jgi:hypothetical protein
MMLTAIVLFHLSPAVITAHYPKGNSGEVRPGIQKVCFSSPAEIRHLEEKRAIFAEKHPELDVTLASSLPEGVLAKAGPRRPPTPSETAISDELDELNQEATCATKIMARPKG